MSIQDRDQWIHECFAENYDILVVRAKRRAGNDPILRNEIEDCVIEAFEMAWSKYRQLKHHPCILGWLTQTVYNKIDNLRMRASTKMSRQAADIDDPAVMQIEDKRAQKRLEEWYEQQEQREKIEMILTSFSLSSICSCFILRCKAFSTLRSSRWLLSSHSASTIVFPPVCVLWRIKRPNDF